MTENQFDDSEIRRSIRQARQRLSRRTEAEREAIIQDAIREALAAEVEEERAESARTTQAIKQALADPRAEAQRARKEARDKALILLLLLVVLLLIAAATDRPNIIRLPGVNDAPPLSPRIDSAPNGQSAPGTLNSTSAEGLGATEAGAAIAAPGSLSGETYSVGAMFRQHYDRNGGQAVFGLPISNPIEVNGRTVQWFERARLEQWPEYANTPYAIQGGRVGVEFTTGMDFPNQVFSISRPGLRFFRETDQAVRERFLSFWEQNGGLMVLGYPISDEVQERLPDGQIRTVQYFERARLELHGDQVQIGLLGRGLYLNESRPQIIAPVRPTAVPMP